MLLFSQLSQKVRSLGSHFAVEYMKENFQIE